MPRNRILFAVAWACLLCGGCASLPARTVERPPSPGENVRYLEKAPPVAQQAYRCGPAALASVFRYWGRDADALRIGRSLIGRGERGVLNFVLAQYARSKGFWTETPSADLPQLKQWIRRGIPPIGMLRVGPWGMPVYHFVVVKGFNDADAVLYANTGRAQTQAISYRNFQKRWESAGGWLLVICPPEQVSWNLTPSQAADLALLLERSQKWALAQGRYEEALQAMPQSQPIRFNLANVLLQLGQREKAKILYQKLLEEEPANASYSNNLAWVYLQERNYRQSIRVIEEALSRGTERRYDLLDTLGLAYCRLKDPAKGRTYLAEALHKTPPEKVEARQAIQSHLNECP